MKYSRVWLESVGYELAPVVVTSQELEAHLSPAYTALRIAPGQLQALTGIQQRRWWQPNTTVSQGAIAAARKAMLNQSITVQDLGAVIYTGVCREHYEPATACQVAAALGVHGRAAVYDLSNACLGMLSGMLDIANRIELGQIRAGMVVACESSREINETMLEQLNQHPTIERFTTTLATFTGGSGAAAIVLSDGSFSNTPKPQLLGGVQLAEPQHHELCRWGTEALTPNHAQPYMRTDAVGVMNHGIKLGQQTWQAFCKEIGWNAADVDRTICHQVGEGHRQTILQTLGLNMEHDFITYPYLGNMGTVSLPITAAIAKERGKVQSGHRVAMLGIGSGLNCMMLAVQW